MKSYRSTQHSKHPSLPFSISCNNALSQEKMHADVVKEKRHAELYADLRAMALEEIIRVEGDYHPSEERIQAEMAVIKEWPIIKAAFS